MNLSQRARDRMKTAAFVILFLVGVIQIALGVLVGRLRIYAIEMPFWHALGISEQNSRAFARYIGILKDQWQIVAWLGVITLLATGLLFFSLASVRDDGWAEKGQGDY